MDHLKDWAEHESSVKGRTSVITNPAICFAGWDAPEKAFGNSYVYSNLIVTWYMSHCSIFGTETKPKATPANTTTMPFVSAYNFAVISQSQSRYIDINWDSLSSCPIKYVVEF